MLSVSTGGRVFGELGALGKTVVSLCASVRTTTATSPSPKLASSFGRRLMLENQRLFVAAMVRVAARVVCLSLQPCDRVNARKTARLTYGYSIEPLKLTWPLAVWSLNFFALSFYARASTLLKLVSRACVVSFGDPLFQMACVPAAIPISTAWSTFRASAMPSVSTIARAHHHVLRQHSCDSPSRATQSTCCFGGGRPPQCWLVFLLGREELSTNGSMFVLFACDWNVAAPHQQTKSQGRERRGEWGGLELDNVRNSSEAMLAPSASSVASLRNIIVLCGGRSRGSRRRQWRWIPPLFYVAHFTCAWMSVCWSQHGTVWSCVRFLWFHNTTVKPDTPHIPCCHLGQAHSSSFSLPCPPCCVLAWLPQTTHQVLGSLCLWAFVQAAGLIPLTEVGSTVSCGGAGSLYPVGGVVLLVGFARVTGGPVVLGGLCPCYQ